ncbi:MAG: GNAT family N-acetyltransferase, partial [Cellulosilyticaceae bacterium]
ELSLVAKVEDRVVGHVLLTKMWVQEGEKCSEVLALAPVAVLPEYQSKGVGSKLIQAGLTKAKEFEYRGVIVLGHAQYYPRFGFKVASGYGINAPFEVPDEVFMALELIPGGLEGISGMAVYSPAFMG